MGRLSLTAVISTGVLLMATVMTASCEEIKFGGLTAQEAFPDPRVGVLVQAALDGDWGQVNRSIQAGTDVNASGAQGVTPIIWVLAARNTEAAEHLLKAGADPNKKMDNGHSATSLAAGGNNPAMLEIILRYGGDPNAIGPDGDPLLLLAALHHRATHLRLLLKHGADINSSQNDESAADVAAAVGDFEQVAYLLEQGLNYNLQGLARTVEIRKVPANSDAQRWKDKVIEMLKARGVRYPPQQH